MSKYPFSGLIKCQSCGKYFTGKKQKGVPHYVCAGYNNKQTECKRFAIKESDLLDIVTKHFQMKDRFNESTIDDPISRIKIIEVDNENRGYVIKYLHEDESMYSIVKDGHYKV